MSKHSVLQLTAGPWIWQWVRRTQNLPSHVRPGAQFSRCLLQSRSPWQRLPQVNQANQMPVWPGPSSHIQANGSWQDAELLPCNIKKINKKRDGANSETCSSVRIHSIPTAILHISVWLVCFCFFLFQVWPIFFFIYQSKCPPTYKGLVFQSLSVCFLSGLFSCSCSLVLVLCVLFCLFPLALNKSLKVSLCLSTFLTARPVLSLAGVPSFQLIIGSLSPQPSPLFSSFHVLRVNTKMANTLTHSRKESISQWREHIRISA